MHILNYVRPALYSGLGKKMVQKKENFKEL